MAKAIIVNRPDRRQRPSGAVAAEETQTSAALDQAITEAAQEAVLDYYFQARAKHVQRGLVKPGNPNKNKEIKNG